MPHFMVRRRRRGGVRLFHNAPQLGKRFFYDLNTQGEYPLDRNTVINYEANLALSRAEFRQLIRNITGNQNPTSATRRFNYHLDKNQGLIDMNYCKNTLQLPDDINGYPLAKIGIAANYLRQYNKKLITNGNVLFIFADQNNNEVCISIHIKYSRRNANYLPKLIRILNDGANRLTSRANPFWQLNPYDDFNRLGYVVTDGAQEEIDYRRAYNAAINEAHRISNEMPFA